MTEAEILPLWVSFPRDQNKEEHCSTCCMRATQPDALRPGVLRPDTLGPRVHTARCPGTHALGPGVHTAQRPGTWSAYGPTPWDPMPWDPGCIQPNALGPDALGPRVRTAQRPGTRGAYGLTLCDAGRISSGTVHKCSQMTHTQIVTVALSPKLETTQMSVRSRLDK